jgi:5'-nucleotidase
MVLFVAFAVMGCAQKREELPTMEPTETAAATPAPVATPVEKPAVIETPGPMPPPPPPVRVERNPTVKTPVAKPVVEKGTPTTHKVKKGDTLSSIAKEVYGDANLWKKIADANKDKIPNPNKLKIGTVLTIPPR